MWIFTREIVTTSCRGKAANIRLESQHPAMNNDRERTSRCSGTKIVDPLENARYRLESARLSGPDQLRVLFAIVEFIGAVSECNLPVANLSSSVSDVASSRDEY